MKQIIRRCWALTTCNLPWRAGAACRFNFSRTNGSRRATALFALGAWAVLNAAALADPTPIVEPSGTEPVDYAAQVRPILERNCLACHNTTKAESDLVLENPSGMQQGGASGPAIVPGNGAQSMLLAVAALESEPHMPPEENSVGAKRLTSEELGLLKRWIDQGAQGSSEPPQADSTLAWQPLPPGVHPVLATALSRDGLVAACSRANQIFLYDTPGAKLIGRLTDPDLQSAGLYERPGVAHLDLVQSLAFSPDGNLLASGGYREVKLWARPHPAAQATWPLGDTAWTLATLSADGQWAATATAEGKLQIWNAATGQAGPALAGHPAAISALCFSADGQRLFSGGADNTLRVWRSTDGALVGTVQLPSPAQCLATSPDGTRLAVGCADRALVLWPLLDLRPLGSQGPAVTSLAWTPDGTQLIAGLADGLVRIWPLDGSAETRHWELGSAVGALVLSPDGARLAAGGAAGLVRLWNVADGDQLGELIGELATAARATEQRALQAVAEARVTAAQAAVEAAKSEKAAKIAAVEKQTGELATAATEAQQATLASTNAEAAKVAAEQAAASATAAQQAAALTKQQADTRAAEVTAAVAATSSLVTAAKSTLEALTAAVTAAQASATAAETALAAQSQDAALAMALEAAKQAVSQAAAAVEGARTALTASEGQLAAQQAALPDLGTAATAAGQALDQANAQLAAANEAKTTAEKAATDAATAAKAAEDKRAAAEKALAAAQAGQAVAEELLARAETHLSEETANQQVRQTAAAEAQAAAAATQAAIVQLAFQPGGELLVADAQGRVQQVRLDPLLSAQSWAAHEGGLWASRSLPSGEVITIGPDRQLKRWTTETDWKLVGRLGAAGGGPDATAKSPLVDRVLALAFSPDGQTLATGGGEPSRSGEVKFWRVADGTLLGELTDAHSDTVFGLDYSPDGRYLATSAADKFVKVFSTATSQRVRSLEGHTHHVLGVRWKFDGSLLASCGADKVIKIWNFDTGEQQRTIAGFNKEVTGVAFVGQTAETLTSSGDAVVRRHNTGDGKTLKSLAAEQAFLFGLAVTADGRLVAAGGDDGVLRLWNPADGALVAQFPLPDEADQQASR